MQDTLQSELYARAEPIEVSATQPLSLRVIDRDVMFDDPMGEATITLAQIEREGPDLVVPIRLGAATTGTVTLHFDRVPR
jgi:hypothetical protein